MLIPQPFHILLQLVCRNPAHFITACARNRAGGQMQLQLCGSLLWHPSPYSLKEIAHLIKHQIVWVAFLDRIVFPQLAGVSWFSRFTASASSQRLFCLNFLVLGLLLFGQIAVFLIRSVMRLGNLLPK